MTIIGSRPRAALLALHILVMGALAAPSPALAMQILDAADHAELRAEVSATGVNRIALAGDRVARVVRAPDGYAVEHDAASGDLYLRPVAADSAAHDPATLFIGTERGFTYRLTLTPSDRDSAQILIRNAAALPGGAAADPVAGGPHIAALVRLVRAVARREPLPGYAIHAGGEALRPGLTLIETWRDPRLAALVFEAARPASLGADGAAGLAGPDAAEKVWTRRSEARLGGIETQLRQIRQEARQLGADNDRLRAKLEEDAADARSVIDRQAATIDELRRRLQPPAAQGVGPGSAPGGDPWFRGQAVSPPAGSPRRPAAAAPTRMIESFELEGEPRSSVADPRIGVPGRARNGAELVADAVAKPVSAWLPAGAHAQAVVLAGVDASAGVSSQGDPRPVLLRITGPAWTAAPSGSGAGTALKVDVDGCTVTGAAHGDLSSEKVYVRFRTMTCVGPRPGTVIETEVAGFVAGSGKTGVRGPVVSREARWSRRPSSPAWSPASARGSPRRSSPRRWRPAAGRPSPTPRSAISAGRASAPGPLRRARRSPTT